MKTERQPSRLAVVTVLAFAICCFSGTLFGQAADPPSDGKPDADVLCQSTEMREYPVYVEQSPVGKERPFDFDLSTIVRSDGRIDAQIGNLRETYLSADPLKWQWKALRATPQIDFQIEQTKNAAGKIIFTAVYFSAVVHVEGEALLKKDTNLAPGFLDYVYGPAVKLRHSKPVYGGLFTSREWPGLNSVDKNRFRSGTMTAAAFTGKDVQEEFPNQTFIRDHQGMVRVERANGEILKARQFLVLEVGDSVKTLSNGHAEIVLAGTAVIKVKPDSEFVIPTDKSNTGEKVSFIKMVRGVLWAKARKKEDPFRVAVPNAICGLRGTEFKVEVLDANRSCFFCRAGEIDIRRPPEADDADRRIIVLKSDESVCITGNRAEAVQARIPVVLRVRVERGGQMVPLAGASIVLRKGESPAAIDGDTTDSQGLATVASREAGAHRIEAAAEGYVAERAIVTVAAGEPTRLDILLKRSPDAPDEPSPAPTAKCSFEGFWMVHYFNNTTGTGEPSLKQRMKIVVRGDQAIGYVGDLWMGKAEEYCSGPLTENGQVWNAKRVVSGQLSQKFDDVHFDPDCNRFVGKWSGEAPHGYAWIGYRMVEVKPPSAAASVVELSSKNRSQIVDVAPGSTLTIKVATYAGTGYQMEMVPPATRALTISGPRDEPMDRPASPKGKISVGVGTWRVYEIKVGPEAQGELPLRFRFFRTPGKTDIEYVLTMQVLEKR